MPLDHTDVLDKTLVLSLNASWMPIGVLSVRKAIVALCSEASGEKAAMALDIEMAVDENGNEVLVYANPVDWATWLTLPVRPHDLYVQAARQQVRVPTVIVSVHFNKVPLRRPRWSTGNVHARDGYVCAYTGEKLTRSTATVDHIVPRSRGGRDDWLNTTSCHRRINTLKADRTPEEAGLKLLRKPTAPPSLPVSATITEPRHSTWLPFLPNA